MGPDPSLSCSRPRKCQRFTEFLNPNNDDDDVDDECFTWPQITSFNTQVSQKFARVDNPALLSIQIFSLYLPQKMPEYGNVK